MREAAETAVRSVFGTLAAAGIKISDRQVEEATAKALAAARVATVTKARKRQAKPPQRS